MAVHGISIGKNRVSARRRDFARRKGRFLPAVRENTKWNSALLGITLVEDKWEVGGGEAMLWGYTGWGSENAHGICASFPLLCCPAHCALKARNKIVSKDARKN